jgi:hypothetical protein
MKISTTKVEFPGSAALGQRAPQSAKRKERHEPLTSAPLLPANSQSRARPNPFPLFSPETIQIGGESAEIDSVLNSSACQNIEEHPAAKMLGFFTQTMQNQGFPWRFKVRTREGLQGMLSGTKEIHDLEALQRLRAGQAVVFQPMRNICVDFSSENLGALAAVAGATGNEVEPVQRLANLSKNTRMSPGCHSFEVSLGAPIEVTSLPELKLLHQLYNPEAKLDSKNPICQGAQQLAYFNQQESNYGWRYFERTENGTPDRVAKDFVSNAVRGALIGAAAGAMIGAPIGLISQSLNAFLLAGAVGAGSFSLYSGTNAAHRAAKGKPITAVEALHSLAQGRPFEIQETQMRSLPVPILGNVTWFSDHGQSTPINHPSELETLHYMQNPAAKIETLPEKGAFRLPGWLAKF